MKVSQAMRLGAALRPQSYGDAFEFNFDACVGSCAIGAALEGNGVPPQHLTFMQTLEQFQIIFGATEEHELETPPAQDLVPVDEDERWLIPGQKYSLTSLMLHLNDDYHWPRERIADYLESVGY